MAAAVANDCKLSLFTENSFKLFDVRDFSICIEAELLISARSCSSSHIERWPRKLFLQPRPQLKLLADGALK
jgi:hypothetical protein